MNRTRGNGMSFMNGGSSSKSLSIESAPALPLKKAGNTLDNHTKTTWGKVLSGTTRFHRKQIFHS